jgi:16S rRNA (guanine527-N7)-methyltransferase
MDSSAGAGLTLDAIARGLADYGIETSPEQIEQIQKYVALLLQWNEKVNITAIQDPREILFRHFCEIMFAVLAGPIEKGRLADVGSGGGFPGLPIKILVPELQVLLIESNAKKATFLAEVSRHLELSGVRVVVQRYEELGEEIAPLDYVCSRALGEFDKLLRWAASPTTAARTIMLWIGAADAETVKRTEGWEWREALAIPHSMRRYLLIGDKKE